MMKLPWRGARLALDMPLMLCIKVRSHAAGSAWAVFVASFMAEKMPGGRTDSIRSHTTLLSKYLMGVHLICSLAYSSCSVFSVSWMKICWSFSLT